MFHQSIFKWPLIQANLQKEGYTTAAKECCGLIEHVLRVVIHQYRPRLAEKDRLSVQAAELQIGKGVKGIERFTMGQLIGVVRVSKFLDMWARTAQRELSSMRLINLDALNHLRNQLMHEGRTAMRVEAEFLFHCLRMILETFDLTSVEPHSMTHSTGHGASTEPHSVRMVAATEDAPPFSPDALAVEEDTWLVLSCTPEARASHEEREAVVALGHTEPATPGQVLVKGHSPLRFLAIIHDLDQEPTWREVGIEDALEAIFKESESRQLQSLALPLLGTVHGSLEHHRFAALLQRVMERTLPTHLQHLWLVVPSGITPDLHAWVSALEKRVFNSRAMP